MLSVNMHHREFEPPLALQDSIKCFWYDKIELQQLQSNFEVVPDGYAEIIFYFGSPCSVYNNGILLQLPSPFMMGLLNKPVVFHAEDNLEIIGIRCYPWAVFNLLGLPADKKGAPLYEHTVAGLQHILGNYINSNRIEEAMAEVTQYFIDKQVPAVMNNVLKKAGSAMKQANGTIQVSGVAAAAHATVRTLERKFKESSGYTVKDVLCLMRFEQVRNHLWLEPDTNLAGLAVELGYTDQSHLSRDFKRYCSTTPAAFARKAKTDMLTLPNIF
jgi:AraC-like DNA-binding protein